MAVSQQYFGTGLGHSACVLFFTVLAAFAPLTAGANEPPSFAQQLSQWLSGAQREDVRQRETRLQQLEQVPPLSPGHSGRNIGFHSHFQPERNTPISCTIDLGKLHPVDRIAVFPVRGVFRGALVRGYGFPKHFVIELSKDATFSDPVHALDSQSSPIPPRPDYPIQFVLEKPIEARFLRLRILEHWTREDGRILSALGEIMVFADQRNVALRAAVNATSFISYPDWHHDFIVDGQTDLGLPVMLEASPTNGFLTTSSRNRFDAKWIQIELPRVVEVDEVVLIPAQPVDAPDQFGHRFPRRFRVHLSEDPGLTNSRTIYQTGDWVFPNPGDNPVAFSGGGFPARFVRLDVSELARANADRNNIALAEMQVFERGVNIAQGATVTASDVFDVEGFLDVWRPEYLVDGYSSQNRLIGLEDWLDGLDVRRELETQIAHLTGRIETRTQRTLGWVLSGAGLVVLTSVGVIGMLLVRRKQALAWQQETLRARIARDLHDDLGSRLGGMRLLSESLLGDDELPEELRSDLDLLRQSSGDATDAMRDIVWLLDTRERSLEKLRQQLKLLVPSILGSIPWEFHIDAAPDAEVDFEFRRQVVLAFRESLNNAARHAKSTLIKCRVGGDHEHFWFEVRDNGVGFDENTIKRGLGLSNLRKRVESLQGEVLIESNPGKSTPGTGTIVRFTVPYRRTPKRRFQRRFL